MDLGVTADRSWWSPGGIAVSLGSIGSPARRHGRKQRRHIAGYSKPRSGGVTWDTSSLPQALFGRVPVRMLPRSRPLQQIRSYRIMRKYKPKEKIKCEWWGRGVKLQKDKLHSDISLHLKYIYNYFNFAVTLFKDDRRLDTQKASVLMQFADSD